MYPCDLCLSSKEDGFVRKMNTEQVSFTLPQLYQLFTVKLFATVNMVFDWVLKLNKEGKQ